MLIPPQQGKDYICMGMQENIYLYKLKNKFKWNLKRNWHIFIEENPYKNVVCEMVVILPRPQCVETSYAMTCVSSIEVLYVIPAGELTAKRNSSELTIERSKGLPLIMNSAGFKLEYVHKLVKLGYTGYI